MEVFMQRAIDLAELGRPWVSPNPMVGCVIEHQGSVIGEGWHKAYGGPHAEVNAINAVENKDLLKDATAFITLEPCAHFGKTPPCADLLVKHRLKKVYIASLDPNPLVAGKGLDILRKAGIQVEVGLLASQTNQQNARFFKSFRSDLPYIILKWAQSADGFINGKGPQTTQISNRFTQILLHKWRSEEDGIWVGSNTVNIDNPSLTNRLWPGKNPIRLVRASASKFPDPINIKNNEAVTIWGEGLSTLDFLKEIKQRGIHSVLVEGGATTLQDFIDREFYDEIRIFESKNHIITGLKAPILPFGLKFDSMFLEGNQVKSFLKIYDENY